MVKQKKIIPYIVGSALLLCLVFCMVWCWLFFERVQSAFEKTDPNNAIGRQHINSLIATSQPLTSSLECYYHVHGSYPPDLAHMYPHYLPSPKKATPGEWNGFYYMCDPSNQAYDLTYILGFDPVLRYRHTVGPKSPQDEPEGWVYDSGNGTPSTPL